MKKKYFFFDIDGTLTDRHTHRVVPSAKETLKKLEENGHFVAIATGRAHYKARPIMDELGLSNMVCGGGGSLVVNHECVQNKPLNKENALRVLEEVDRLGYGYLLSFDDSNKVYSCNNKFREQAGERPEPTEYVIDSNLDLVNGPEIYKMFVSVNQSENVLFETRNLVPNLYFLPEFLVFQLDEKDRGIYKMTDYLDAPIEDVVVFGDDVNDLVMFKEVWTSIAMGNAIDELKEKATFVTKRNVDDGIQFACETFGWI